MKRRQARLSGNANAFRIQAEKRRRRYKEGVATNEGPRRSLSHGESGATMQMPHKLGTRGVRPRRSHDATKRDPRRL